MGFVAEDPMSVVVCLLREVKKIFDFHPSHQSTDRSTHFNPHGRRNPVCGRCGFLRH